MGVLTRRRSVENKATDFSSAVAPTACTTAAISMQGYRAAWAFEMHKPLYLGSDFKTTLVPLRYYRRLGRFKRI